MNRAERRRKEREARKGEAVYNVKEKDLLHLHEVAMEQTTKRIVPIVLLTSLIVLRDKYGFGKKRLGDFAEHVFEQYDGVDKGYVSFDDIADAIDRETGVKIMGTKEGFHVDTGERAK